jgi:hypothetical protein
LLQVAARLIVFEKVEVVDNPDYIQSSISIGELSGESVLNGNFTVFKTINYKIMVYLLTTFLISMLNDKLIYLFYFLNLIFR